MINLLGPYVNLWIGVASIIIKLQYNGETIIALSKISCKQRYHDINAIAVFDTNSDCLSLTIMLVVYTRIASCDAIKQLGSRQGIWDWNSSIYSNKAVKL